MKVIAEHGDSGQLQESQKHGPFQLEGPSEKTSPSLSSPTAEVPEDNDWLKATQQGRNKAELDSRTLSPSMLLSHPLVNLTQKYPSLQRDGYQEAGEIFEECKEGGSEEEWDRRRPGNLISSLS